MLGWACWECSDELYIRSSWLTLELWRGENDPPPWHAHGKIWTNSALKKTNVFLICAFTLYSLQDFTLHFLCNFAYFTLKCLVITGGERKKHTAHLGISTSPQRNMGGEKKKKTIPYCSSQQETGRVENWLAVLKHQTPCRAFGEHKVWERQQLNRACARPPPRCRGGVSSHLRQHIFDWTSVSSTESEKVSTAYPVSQRE